MRRIPRFLENGVHGVLVPPSYADKLSSAVVRLIMDKIVRRPVVEVAFSKVWDHKFEHAWRRMVEALKTYNDILPFARKEPHDLR